MWSVSWSCCEVVGTSSSWFWRCSNLRISSPFPYLFSPQTFRMEGQFFLRAIYPVYDGKTMSETPSIKLVWFWFGDLKIKGFIFDEIIKIDYCFDCLWVKLSWTVTVFKTWPRIYFILFSVGYVLWTTHKKGVLTSNVSVFLTTNLKDPLSKTLSQTTYRRATS